MKGSFRSDLEKYGDQIDTLYSMCSRTSLEETDSINEEVFNNNNDASNSSTPVFTNFEDENKHYYLIFQRGMKVLLFWGQCWGLNPVMGIWDENPSNVRFQLDSFRLWYSVFVWLCQFVVTCLSLYSMFSASMNLITATFFCFYFSTCAITMLSIIMASKWPLLAREVATTKLSANPHLKKKCIITFALFVCLALVEHTFAVIANVSFVFDCYELKENKYKRFIQINFVFLFNVGLPYHFTVGIFLQFLTFACTVNWNYTDVFIICISFYLTSVLEELNKKIKLCSKKGVPPSTWRLLREAYTRATRLVRIFDKAINQIIFVSLATSLFFVCLQLFNVLSNGLTGKKDENCPNFPSGPFGGYEHSIYYFVSLMAVLTRSLAVAFIAAEVHTASKAALSSLYEVPAGDYFNEVQRFIEQVHGDTVALSGYNFFYMTRDLILTVAGTIVTYELVLLQFKGENTINSSQYMSSWKNISDTA